MDLARCPFAAPLIAADYGCANAESVTRRGGPDVACRSGAASARCAEIYDRLKAAALPAFGVEDDLTTMPHSVLVKVQYGGLLGLQRLVDGKPSERVNDVDGLATGAVARFGTLQELPYAELAGGITAFKLRRRS